LIIDSRSNFLNALATRVFHHMDMSVIFVAQDGFAKQESGDMLTVHKGCKTKGSNAL
jgi:hypothetical protein